MSNEQPRATSAEQIETHKRIVEAVMEQLHKMRVSWWLENEQELSDAIWRALVVTDDLRQPAYCELCDKEHQLHEDAHGFHHVVKGERVACASAQGKQE